MDNAVGVIYYRAEVDTAKAIASAKMLDSTLDNMTTKGGAQLSAFEAKSQKTFSAFSGALALATKAVGISAVIGFGLAVKSAGEYESSLSALKYASNATNEEMARMSALSRQLGKDISLPGVTAKDASVTMTELSKAGLSVNDTMNATKGAMSLAKAGNIDFAESAVITASALNAFSLEGKEANKVADALASGANASQAELHDLAMGMQQSATVAKQFKLTVNDNVTALALFANNGIKGTDAGTSLKTMLISLAKPSADSAKAMKEIGFEAYDASGNFVGMAEMSKRLKKSLSGLTDEQKQATLATIFGTDAFRAGAIMADNAGESWDKMSASVAKVGSANDASASKMGNFTRSVESLQNSMYDIGLTIGQKVLPTLASMAQAVSNNIEPAFERLSDGIKTYGPLIAGVTAGFLAWQAVLLATAVKTYALATATAVMNTAMAMNPFALLAVGAIALTTAMGLQVLQANSSTASSERLRVARENLKIATDNQKIAEDNLRGATLNQEGATLRVESATNAYNDALKRYGPTSLEARQASYNLKQAREDLRLANDRLKKSEDDSRTAMQNTAKASEAVRKAMAEVQTSVYGARDSWLEYSKAINQASRQPAPKQQPAITSGQSSAPNLNYLQKRASGGPVRSGTPYLVGDNPDGSINKTTEMFVPRSSGTIIPNKDLFTTSGGGGTSFEIHNITIANEVDGDRWLRKLTNNQEIIGASLVPRQEYGV